MAIVLVVKKWRKSMGVILLSKQIRKLLNISYSCVLWTNHNKNGSELMEFSFKVHYKPGVQNKAVDALSRHGEILELKKAFSLWQCDDILDWETEGDGKLSSIKQNILAGKPIPNGYNICNGCLLYKERLVLPKGSTRIPHLIQEFHSLPLGGHYGYVRTYKRLATNLYWEGIKNDV